MTEIRPPAHIAPYVEALGRDLAIRFLLEFGGALLYIDELFHCHPVGQRELASIFGRTFAIKDKARCALRSGSTCDGQVPQSVPH